MYIWRKTNVQEAGEPFLKIIKQKERKRTTPSENFLREHSLAEGARCEIIAEETIIKVLGVALGIVPKSHPIPPRRSHRMPPSGPELPCHLPHRCWPPPPLRHHTPLSLLRSDPIFSPPKSLRPVHRMNLLASKAQNDHGGFFASLLQCTPLSR